MIELEGKTKDLDGFQVTRILPHFRKRMVGPFIFLDHMGPATFEAGDGINVRPHPHIGLATLTYLFEGSMLHRDSLGNNAEIFPGDVNWMTAGRGIVHSERETLEVIASRHQMDGLQAWVALPKAFAEIEPKFSQIKKCELPHRLFEGSTLRLLAGEAYGLTSPIKTYSPMFYLDIAVRTGGVIERPNQDQECAVYLLWGEVEVDGIALRERTLTLFENETTLVAKSNARFILLGGESWPEIPRMYWNFVSFDPQRIEQAKRDWTEGRFASIPGDDAEHSPMP